MYHELLSAWLEFQITFLAFASNCHLVWAVIGEILKLHMGQEVSQAHTDLNFILLYIPFLYQDSSSCTLPLKDRVNSETDIMLA